MYINTTRTHLAKDTKKTALSLVQFGLDWLYGNDKTGVRVLRLACFGFIQGKRYAACGANQSGAVHARRLTPLERRRGKNREIIISISFRIINETLR